MEDAGTARFNSIEIERLREYLVKGGFLLVSDYHGTYGQRSNSTRRSKARLAGPRSFRSSISCPPDHPMLANYVPGVEAAANGVDQYLASHRRRPDRTLE